MSQSADPSDPRPRPDFGEYASPEEVARITGRPVGADPVPPPAAADPASGASPITPPGRAAPLWDRALTVTLFVVGAWTVAGFVFDPLTFSTSLEASARSAGFTGDVADATIDQIGRVVGITLLVVFVGALVGALLLRPRFRILFWIPLSAAVLSAIVLLVGLSIAVAHVPGLLDQLTR
ncbi:MAG: hypothetical protein HY996_07930 [Micrococcales bacterium]|nr:hypothetical protein [Micrococcales bacterium]